ncbi:MAG: GntR family transcriptional regulator [Fuerstiella sp.]|nr:GntR family transcriptional regulator [Fuerstiella sp.]
MISRTIREQVTRQLRDAVVSGEYPSGQALRETEVAERFGVSRGPIRDAFLQLSHEGFLAYQANCGVTVRKAPDSSNRDFIVSLRQQTECYALKHGFDRLTNSPDAVEEALKNLRTACTDGDIARIAYCDVGFHQVIMEACGGEDLLPVWKSLCSQMLLSYSRLDDNEQIYQEHASILEAIRAGSKQKTIVAIKANIR